MCTPSSSLVQLNSSPVSRSSILLIIAWKLATFDASAFASLVMQYSPLSSVFNAVAYKQPLAVVNLKSFDVNSFLVPSEN